jgi:hypothetical protein
MLGSARGAGNPAQAQIAARTAQATGANSIAQNATLGRVNEQLGALSAAGGLYGNVAGEGLTQSGQDINQNQFNAGQTNNINQGNQTANLNANTTLLGATEGQNANAMNAAMQGQNLGSRNTLGFDQIASSAYSDAAKRNAALAGSVMQGVGGLASIIGV